MRDERVAMAVHAMRADETLSTQSIRQPVTTREGIGAAFDAQITYLKGASMFRMFESFVGRDAWQKFIHGYLRAHAWGNASADDFLTSLADQLGPPIAAAVRTFLEQPGVPRITARLRCEANQAPRIELSQTRSLPAGVSDPKPKLWSLPVCVRYGDAKDSFRECYRLSTETAEFELAGWHTAARPAPWHGCPTWTILNADAIGYYRSTVDPAVARALFTPSSPIAKLARPTPSERMMLVEDLRAQVARDELALDKLLELVPVIAADPDDKVARSALSAASLPMRGLDDAMYLAAKRWYLKAFGTRARQLGWMRGPKDSDELHELRQAIVPLVANEDPPLSAEATRLADRWLSDRTGISDDLAWQALTVAAHHGDAARFERYLAAAKAARDRSEHQRLLGTLGTFTDPAIANRALALVLGHEFDLRDSIEIVGDVIGRRETRDLGIAFVKQHLDALLARMRDDEAAVFLSSLAGVFCDVDRRAQMAELTTPRAEKIDGARSHVTRALEQADQCIALVQHQLPALHRILGTR
jgi:aminopeptidase N